MPEQTLFSIAGVALAALFLWSGMDVRHKAHTRDLVAPMWQTLMKLLAFLLIGAFLWVVVAMREPAVIDWIGLGCMASGTAFVWAAKRMLGPTHTFSGQYREVPHLVTGGVYAITRNPLYLGVFQCEFGALLCAIHQLPGLFPSGYPYWFAGCGAALVYVVSFNWVMARREAHQLEQQCGDTYRRYASRVPFLIPFTRQRQEVN